MGPYLFQQLTPRLRSWLGQSQELMLQRLIGLLITALAMLILVNGLRATYPILAWEGPGGAENGRRQVLVTPQRHAC